MRREMVDELLFAAQDVVNDAEPDPERSGGAVVTVDANVFARLQVAVKTISDEAVEEIQRIQAENRASAELLPEGK